MPVNIKIVKGYFFWSIPFLFFSCNTPTLTKKAVSPKDCEWYAVINEKAEADKNNNLGLYALRFYPDGNYTFCADLIFEQGKWNFDEQRNILVLQPSEKKNDDDVRYLIDQSLPGNKAKFSFYHGVAFNKSNQDEMIEVHALTNRSKYDPYSLSFHSWRIKPNNEETPDQIQQRVIAYLRFLQALYIHAKENGLENAGGNWYPQPIKFYSSKASMAYANDLIDWYNCFFTDEQGIKGYQLISGALMKVKIEGKDDVDRNINCIEQLLTQIEK